MTAKITKIAGLNGMDITPYSNMYADKDVGRYGKGIQDLIDQNFPHILGKTNYGNGPDILEFPGSSHGIDIKSVLKNRRADSFTTIVSMSDQYRECMFWDLPVHIQNKILADRLWVEHDTRVVTDHAFVYNDEFESKKLINAWNDIAAQQQNYRIGKSFTRTGYMMEYKKDTNSIHWRLRNDLVDQTKRYQSDRSFNHRFNDMFDYV